MLNPGGPRNSFLPLPAGGWSAQPLLPAACRGCPARSTATAGRPRSAPLAVARQRGHGAPSDSSWRVGGRCTEVWLPSPGSHRLIDVTGRRRGPRPGGPARSAHDAGTEEGVGMTSVLTRDPKLETAEEPVLVRRGTMDIA